MNAELRGQTLFSEETSTDMILDIYCISIQLHALKINVVIVAFIHELLLISSPSPVSRQQFLK